MKPGANQRPRRRLVRRVALGGFALGAAWLLLLPVPLGWAVNAAARRVLPAGCEAQVASGSFRWGLGRDLARLEFGEFSLRITDGTRATFSDLVVEFEKAALWRACYLPRQLTLRRPRLVIGPALDAPGVAASPAAPPDLPALLAALERALPAPGGACRIVIEEYTAEFTVRGTRHVLPAATLETRLRREGETLEATAVLFAATAPRGPRLTLGATASLARGMATFSADLPAAEIPALSAPDRPAATASFSAKGEIDLGAPALRAAGLELHGAGWQLPAAAAGGAPLRVERVELRASATRAAPDDDLRVELPAARLAVEGAQLDASDTALTLGSEPRLAWRVRAQADPAAIAARLAALRPDLPAALAGVLRHTTRLDAESTGEIRVGRATDGAWSLRAAEGQAQLGGAISAQPLEVSLSLRTSAGGRLRGEARLAPLVPRALAPAFTPDLPLAAVDLSVQAEAHADFSATGELLGAEARVIAAAGEVRAWGPIPHAVAVRRAEGLIRIRPGENRIEIPALVAETALGRFTAEQLALHRESGGGFAARGRIAAADIAGAELETLLPPEAVAELAAIRATPADFALAQAEAAFELRLRPSDHGGWTPLATELKSTATLSVARQPLTLRCAALQPADAPELALTWAVDEFRPSTFGRMGHGDFAATDFDLPLRLSGEAKLDAKTTALRTAKLRAQAGAGRVQLAPLGALPLHAAELEAVFDAATRTLRVPHAGLALAEKFRLEAGSIEIALASPLRATGRVRLPATGREEIFAWWPAALRPDLRAAALDAIRAARVELPALEFALADGQLLHARGELRTSDVRLLAPGVPHALEFAAATLALDYPRARLAMPALTAPGLRASGLEVIVENFTDPAPGVNARGAVEFDLAALPEWLPAPAPVAGRGPVRAEFAVRLPPGAADDIPLTLEAALDLSRTLPVGATRPITLRAEARGWRTRAPLAAAFSLAADDLAGLPLRAAGALEWRAAPPGAAQLELTRFDFGRTSLRGAWSQPAPEAHAIHLAATRVDVAELFAAAAPWLALRPAPAPAGASANPDATARPGRIDLTAEAAELDFGGERRLHGARVEATLADRWPAAFRLRATEGAHNALRLELGPRTPAATQPITVAVDDAAALLQTLTEPLRRTPLRAGPLAEAAEAFARIPTLLAGGSLSLHGELARRAAGFAAAGDLALENAALLRAPRVVQLLALKSGRSLQASPLIRRLAVGRWSITPEAIALAQLSLAGSGLIDRVKVHTARYDLAGERIAIDCDYFGVGFKVTGTRADPQLFLRETALIRAIGQPVEFDFFGEDPPPPARAK